VKAEIWSRVRAGRPSPWKAWFRPVVALPVGAALAVAAFFAVQQTNGPAALHPAVNAGYYFAVHNAAVRQENPLTDRSAPVLNVIPASDVSAEPSMLVEEARAASGDDPAR
jgi:hypothetical protein